MSAPYLGNRAEDSTISGWWPSNDKDGASVDPTDGGTISVYKDANDTQSVAGLSVSEPADSLTGAHRWVCDTSADAFYATGCDYAVMKSAMTIDGEVVNTPVAHFSIEHGFTNVNQISGDAGAADNAEAMLDGTGGVALTLNSLVVNAAAAGGAINIDNSAGPGIHVNVSAGNHDAVHLQGAGTGNGLYVIGGATGNGLRVNGGATSGAGLYATTPTSGNGITAEGGGNGGGLVAIGSGTGLDFDATTTDGLQVDVLEISSDATAASDLELLVENCKGTDHKVLISADAQDLSGTLDVNTKTITNGIIVAATLGADAITAATVAADVHAEAADAVWDELSTGHVSAGKAGQQLWTDVDAILDDTGNAGVVIADGYITAAKIGADAITSAKIADNAIAAEHSAAAAIDNATFAADVGSTAYATNIIALAANKALANYDPPTNTEMDAAFTAIKGATWATTDTLEAIRDAVDSDRDTQEY